MIKRLVWCGVLVVALALSMPVAANAALPLKAPASAFPAPDQCSCHEWFVNEWQASMHAQALDDPAYQTKLQQAKLATKGALGAFCNQCHGPIATMTGTIKTGKITPATNGITCAFCHQASATTRPPGNVSFIMKLDRVFRAQIARPKAPHRAGFSAFHMGSDLCGGCHNVRHPINGMHLEASYLEWSRSEYAKRGIQCQACHMSQSAGFVGPTSGTACAGGPQRPVIYQMTFIGANVAQGDPEQATRLLQSAATLQMEAPDIVTAGAEVTVTITNANAGHYLPTGLTEVREMWLEVAAESADGAKEVLGTRKFGTVLEDKNGKFPVELWEAQKIRSDDRIPPKASVTSTFPVKLPSGKQEAILRAALYYRSLPEQLAEEAKVENPTTTMASAERHIFASEEAANNTARDVAPSQYSGFGPVLLYALLGIGIGIAAIVYWGFLADRRKRA